MGEAARDLPPAAKSQLIALAQSTGAEGRAAALFERQAIIDLAAWEGKDPPARQWMVENTFLQGTVGLVAGDGGIGKSLLLQQLSTCAVLGRSWLGRALTPGKVLYIACEDDRDELLRRQAGINRELGTTMTDVFEGGLHLVPRVGQDNALMYLERSTWKMAATSFFEWIAWVVTKNGYQYVIIDTATQTFRGNQNDEIQVMDFISELRRLAVRMQGVVILTKHPSMAGRALGTGESGNVAWNNSVRARLYLHKDKSGQLVLDTLKSNYAPAGEALPLRWERGVYVLDKPEPAVQRSWYDQDCGSVMRYWSSK